VAAADNIQVAAVFPAPSDQAGRGVSIALSNGTADGREFLHTIGLIKAYKQHYADVRDEWQKRLDGLRGAIERMSAGDQGP
jgi:hypothetical protein